MRPALWAMYYAWYETAAGPHARWKQWSDDPTSVKNPMPKSRAQPLIGYYDSDNPEVTRWHMKLAKASGIDAFLVSWWGPANISGAAFEKVVLPVAAQENFKVAMCSELAQFHDDVKTVARQMAEVLRRTKDNPAYLHMNGKPVVYLYQVPFAPKLTTTTFIELRTLMEKEVGPVYWVMDKISNPNGAGLTIPDEWLEIPEIPMVGFYGTFSITRKYDYANLAPTYLHLAEQAHAVHKKIFLPVHPGHDNSAFRPDDHFVMPRENGKTLRGYLRAATEARADVVLLTSFNEWPETTVVEPSSSWADPYFYLKLLAKWKGVEFKTPPLPAMVK